MTQERRTSAGQDWKISRRGDRRACSFGGRASARRGRDKAGRPRVSAAPSERDWRSQSPGTDPLRRLGAKRLRLGFL